MNTALAFGEWRFHGQRSFHGDTFSGDADTFSRLHEGEGMAWMQNMYREFEAMCLGFNDILEREGLQKMGVHVKQLCMREVLLQPGEDIMDGGEVHSLVGWRVEIAGIWRTVVWDPPRFARPLPPLLSSALLLNCSSLFLHSLSQYQDLLSYPWLPSTAPPPPPLPFQIQALGPRNPPSSSSQAGTAFNGVVEELKQLTTRVAHVLPVSDDGGSTAEIVRVLGGPAVGDIRSRCLRLSDQNAKSQWYDIVEGEHSFWKGVSKPYSETIRAFLVYFQNEILRRPNESFCFSNGSIGNFFFAGARIFFQSLDAAIFLFSRVSDIPAESLVLPVISTNDRLTLGCELWDGTIIRGQNEISHPTNGFMQPIDKLMELLSAAIEVMMILSCQSYMCMMTSSLIDHGGWVLSNVLNSGG
ncbi:hypothetical protein OIU76_026281 [Salix suchowensis]|nr:hypothetical protein OIU76_026281 [Salix suchowensis]